MLEIISALPACLIFLGLMGVVYLLMRRQQQNFNQGFRQVADQLNFTYSEAEAEIGDDLARFALFQKIGRQRIRALVQGNQADVSAQIMNVTSNMRGVDQRYTDYYTVIRLRHHSLRLPDFALRSKGSDIEGTGPEIRLAQYPSISQKYRLTGAPDDVVRDLFQNGLGHYFNDLAERDIYRNIEGSGNQLLYYRYQRKPARPEEIRQLYNEGVQLLRLLVQETGES